MLCNMLCNILYWYITETYSCRAVPTRPPGRASCAGQALGEYSTKKTSEADSEPGAGHSGQRAFRRLCGGGGPRPDGEPDARSATSAETEPASRMRAAAGGRLRRVAARPVLVVG